MKRAAAVLVAVAAVAVLVRRQWTVVHVSGGSMLPTLRDGDRVLARRGRRPRRGDLIVLVRPPGPVAVPAGAEAVAGGPPAVSSAVSSERLVKRVTALEGDPMPDGTAVPPGHAFVLSDNDGLDSRMFGPVPLTTITAVVRRHLR